MIVNETIFEKYFRITSAKNMKQFISDNFLLNNRTAEKLFHEFSEHQPIIDFHCHLSPALIADDHQFGNITGAWLEGDHYKWRAMRINGISEEYCTGNAPDKEKFMKWAKTVPRTLGNPLYHWSHLELARYFNINELLSSSTAEHIYEKASSMLQTKGFSTRGMIRKMNAEVICTTDDPADSLKHHRKIKETFEIKVLPTWRPDNVLKTEDPERFKDYIHRLEEASSTEIKDFDSLILALDNRHQYFDEHGCRIADHGIDRFYFTDSSEAEVEKCFLKLLKGNKISEEETEKYRTYMMTELCKMNWRRGWTQQFHVGAIRNNNRKMLGLLGPDTGWDSIGPAQDVAKMSKFLSALDSANWLGRTILYNLNPSDNEMMITMAGNFNDGSSAAKVQYGAAWWFLDQKSGIEKHLRDLSAFGLLSGFVGMVTDSRSFLSYPRHEYFRRIACNYIGEEVEKGLIPDDDELLKPFIEGISYKNAKEYFGF